MQPVFQGNVAYIMAVRGLLGGGSMIVRQMEALVVVNAMGRVAMSVVVRTVRR